MVTGENIHAPEEYHCSVLLAILGFSIIMGGPAHAGWEPIAVSETGMTVYIDRATIQRESYFVTMSVLHDYQAPEHLSSGSFLSFTPKEQYDCGEVRSRIIGAVVFTDHMGNGTVLYSGTGDDTWQAVTPTTINWALWDAACPEGKSTEVASVLVPGSHPH
jgi:surface-adhesin protein E